MDVPLGPDGKLVKDFSKGKVDYIKDRMYKFYTSPDGEDCLEKTYYYTKYAGICGAVFSVYEMILRSKPQTFHAAVARFGRYTFPFAGMGLAFGTTLCLCGKIRKKTDCTNHVLAGAAAGAVWGVKFNSVRLGHTLAILFGISCGYFRYFYLHNMRTFYVTPKEHRINYPIFGYSFKLYEDPGRPEDP